MSKQSNISEKNVVSSSCDNSDIIHKLLSDDTLEKTQELWLSLLKTMLINGKDDGDTYDCFMEELLSIGELNKLFSMYGQGVNIDEIAKTLSKLNNCKVSSSILLQYLKLLPFVIDAWRARYLDPVYVAVYVDRIYVNISSEDKNKPESQQAVYMLLGIDMVSRKNVLGLWIDPTDSQTMWLDIFNNLKKRRVKNIFFICADNVPGVEEGAKKVFPDTVVLCSIAHLMRNSLEFTKDKKNFRKAIKTVYSAVNKEKALLNFKTFKERWGKKAPDAVKCWEQHLDGIMQLFDYPVAIRKLLSITNDIDGIYASLCNMVEGCSIDEINLAYQALFLRILNLKEKWYSQYIATWPTVVEELFQFPLTKKQVDELNNEIDAEQKIDPQLYADADFFKILRVARYIDSQHDSDES